MDGVMRTLHTSRVGREWCAVGHSTGRRGRAAASVRHWWPRVGFTLIEMMVVVGILALLIAIIAPVTASLLERNKRSQTLATMKVLEQGITAFSNARPLARSGYVRLRPTGQPAPNDWRAERLSDVFGTLPPTPTGRILDPRLDPIDLRVVLPAWSSSDVWTGETTGETAVKFGFLLGTVKNGPWEHLRRDPTKPGSWAWVAPDPGRDAASIECLVFCLNELCAESRLIVNQLPAASKANEDKDIAFENTINWNAHLPDVSYGAGGVIVPEKTEKMVDLTEIIDAWKRPLRYSVKEPVGWDPIADKYAYQASWELRSAGPDGVFAGPFSSEDVSDDVILKGP